MALAADIALDSFRALMTAAPRCCTVWVGHRETALPEHASEILMGAPVTLRGKTTVSVACTVPSSVNLTLLMQLEAPFWKGGNSHRTCDTKHREAGFDIN